MLEGQSHGLVHLIVTLYFPGIASRRDHLKKLDYIFNGTPPPDHAVIDFEKNDTSQVVVIGDTTPTQRHTAECTCPDHAKQSSKQIAQVEDEKTRRTQARERPPWPLLPMAR